VLAGAALHGRVEAGCPDPCDRAGRGAQQDDGAHRDQQGAGKADRRRDDDRPGDPTRCMQHKFTGGTGLFVKATGTATFETVSDPLPPPGTLSSIFAGSVIVPGA
jgi:hypothetical protein